VRDDVLPGLTRIDGCLGLSMLVDRDEGRCIVTSAWRDLPCLRSSGEHRRFLVDDEAPLFTAPPLVEEWEIAVLHRSDAGRHGTWARLAWMKGDPHRADQQVDVYRMLAVPVLDEIEGFSGSSLLIDRRAGRGVSCVTYESRAALDAGREQAMRMRRDAVRLTGVEVERSVEMELPVSHLRVPETV
jgi:heme-degrading monooxygenase HmoA